MRKNTISEIYNKKAQSYEQKWLKYLSHTHQKLLVSFESEKAHNILDISAGTGLFAKLMVEENIEFSHMVLNDISPGMLEIARNRFLGNKKITFASNYSDDLDFEPSSFDTVISLNAFHNYEFPGKTIQEVFRVLKPGGRFYILDWNRTGTFKLIHSLIKFFSGEPIQAISLSKQQKLLKSENFQIPFTQRWGYKYWKFYLVIAEKKGRRKTEI